MNRLEVQREMASGLTAEAVYLGSSPSRSTFKNPAQTGD